MSFGYVVAKDPVLQTIKDIVKRHPSFRFDKAICSGEILACGGHPNYNQQYQAQLIGFKGPINKKNVVSDEAFYLSKLSVYSKEDLPQNPFYD